MTSWPAEQQDAVSSVLMSRRRFLIVYDKYDCCLFLLESFFHRCYPAHIHSVRMRSSGSPA